MSGSERRRAPAWLVYSGLRLALFLVPLGVVYALSGNLVLSAGVAAVLSFCVSLVLLDRQRNAAAAALEQRLERRRSRSDEAAEDSAADQGATSATARPKP